MTRAGPAGSGTSCSTGWATTLRGEPLDQRTGVVESYAIGEDRWHVRESWPPQAERVRWHLDRLADAHGCDGGRLIEQETRAPQAIEYVYDPDDPVPMRGGSGSLAFVLADGGPVHSVEQGSICERADVLSFASAPLRERTRIAGPMRVMLSVSSDAPDTAFTAKLVEGEGRRSRLQRSRRHHIACLSRRRARSRGLRAGHRRTRRSRAVAHRVGLRGGLAHPARRLFVELPCLSCASEPRGCLVAPGRCGRGRTRPLHAGGGRPAYLELPVAALDAPAVAALDSPMAAGE